MKRSLTILFLLAVNLALAGDIVLLSNGHSSFRIGIPSKPTKQEIRASHVFQQYFQKVSGIQLPIDSSSGRSGRNVIFLQEEDDKKVPPGEVTRGESYTIHAAEQRVEIKGGSGKGLLYGTYAFIEKFLGCRKLDAGEAFAPHRKEIRIPAGLSLRESPAFSYREAYMPESLDQEYLDWHRLHRFEELWGLWGHSFDKLVPARQYFRDHPEYFSLVDGKRTPDQLCLSNDTVFRLAIKNLRERMADAEDALYWSVSPNDQGGFCACDRCRYADSLEGGPQGSLIRFVNKVAGVFPHKRITTLAYNQTRHAPRHLAPAKNVYVFVSAIDSYKHLPLPEEPSAAVFRRDLAEWRRLSPNILVWDYVAQFTHYLVPFPIQHTFAANLRFLDSSKVMGILAQGSGDTRSDMQEMKSYLLAKLLWNPQLSADSILHEFLSLYYQESAPYVRGYLVGLQNALLASGGRLDIYGNPVNSRNGYLSPPRMEEYSQWMDKAESAAEASPVLYKRIENIRVGHEYTFFQQAQYYYKDRHGIFRQTDDGTWAVRDGLRDRVKRFCALARKKGVRELSEGGLSPDNYLNYWEEMLAARVLDNKGEGAQVKLAFPAVEDYMNGSPSVLSDGKPGFTDFSYNWLVFEDTPMLAEMDLGKAVGIDTMRIDFLHDPGHGYYVPDFLEVQYSPDGISYVALHPVDLFNGAPGNEKVGKYGYICSSEGGSFKVRFVRISARLVNRQRVPGTNRRQKMKIACDEVWLR